MVDLGERAGVPHFTLAAIVGATIARGEPLTEVLPEILDRADWAGARDAFENAYGGAEDLYPDALPTLARLRADGFKVAVIGNQPAVRRTQLLMLGVDVDVLTTSEALGAAKPEPAFFSRSLDLMGCPDPGRVVYVGDRVDNDVLPSLGAGMRPVWLRRGPWGLLQRLPSSAAEVPQAHALTELPALLANFVV
ncbi:MAG: HAD family hydrolase [Pseudonocardiaceae bacterium]